MQEVLPGLLVHVVKEWKVQVTLLRAKARPLSLAQLAQVPTSLLTRWSAWLRFHQDLFSTLLFADVLFAGAPPLVLGDDAKAKVTLGEGVLGLRRNRAASAGGGPSGSVRTLGFRNWLFSFYPCPCLPFLPLPLRASSRRQPLSAASLRPPLFASLTCPSSCQRWVSGCRENCWS